MTSEKLKQMARVLDALAENRAVQVKCDDGTWKDVLAITKKVDLSAEWRIKPEPRELWIVMREGYSTALASCKDAESANLWIRDNSKYYGTKIEAVLVREVL